MLTRQSVAHSYGHDPGAAPPAHAPCHAHRPAAVPARGGLAGGAVLLTMPPGNWAGTGYGWLGMDPSDPRTWPRPFNPAPGMIGRLNGPLQ